MWSQEVILLISWIFRIILITMLIFFFCQLFTQRAQHTYTCRDEEGEESISELTLDAKANSLTLQSSNFWRGSSDTTINMHNSFYPKFREATSSHLQLSPLLIQWWSGMSVGILMNIRKLLLWPVVARTPRRSAVRYTGHSYAGYSENLSSVLGCSQMTGADSESTCLGFWSRLREDLYRVYSSSYRRSQHAWRIHQASSISEDHWTLLQVHFTLGLDSLSCFLSPSHPHPSRYSP
jgi:hypothetical protein